MSNSTTKNSKRYTNRAAIYVRTSAGEPAPESFGIEIQLAQCQQYATLYGLQVAYTFSDVAISGTKDERERPGLAAALEAAKHKKFDVLILPSIDRLARNGALGLRLYDEFEARGISIAAIKEKLDTSSPAGRLMKLLFLGLAEFERDNILERTTAGRKERAKEDGEQGGRLPLGYVRINGKITIDPDRADVVRLIFNLRQRGITLQAISDQLNAAGVLTARAHQGYDGKWYPSSVREVLLNEEAYRGGKRGISEVRWERILEP